MYCIVALGNPGKEYESTRHNAGHIVAMALPDLPNSVTVMTDTYMNRSGSFVKEALKKYRTSPQELVVIHDDWVFPVGEFRVQFGRGPNGHRGVIDIIEKLDTQEFWRVRVGIGESSATSLKQYVLSPFKKTEIATIREIVPSIAGSIRDEIIQ